jgi:glycosyltransferase involved in cell wall biosynthesis
MMPKLSIVVPIKNMDGKLKNLKSWIDEALLLNCEVILVEDISNLTFTTELDHLMVARTHGNLKKVTGEFGNPGSARNAGKEMARGEWIAFWDSDDVGFPEKALKVLSNVNQETDLIVFSSETREWSSGKIVGENHINSVSSNISQVAGHPGLWRMIFKTQFIASLSFPPFRMAEDQVFLAKVIHKTPEIIFCDEIIYSYFLNVPGQLTSSIEAIADLELAIRDMHKLRGNTATTLLVEELLIRQYISAIRYSAGNKRFKYLFQFLTLLIGKDRIRNAQLLIKVLTK